MSSGAKDLVYREPESDGMRETPAPSQTYSDHTFSPIANRGAPVIYSKSDAMRDTDTDGSAVITRCPDFVSLPGWLRQELRSDHAGEYGAVMIYRGVLAVSKDTSVRQFAERHLLTEGRHLLLMEEIVPKRERTKLLPLWRLMGWLTGAIPALFGRQAVFATIEAVETFVDHHYGQQIERLEIGGQYAALRETLSNCQADEVSHRDEATRLALPRRGALLRLWCAVVGSGSALAVAAAKRI